VLTNRPVNEGVKLDDQSFDFAGLHKLLELNIQEMENFGPNHALVGEGGVEKNSGRAIALLQQAGMAELGPYILAYKGWKIRVYRAIWNAVQQHWKSERWVRVTDNQNLAQYIQINGLQIGPDGKPGLVNAVGSLDVDIILDEGPDHVNAMADMHETLQNILPAIAPVLSPMKASMIVDTLIETSPLPADVKKKFADMAQQEAQQPPQPDPAIAAHQAKTQIDLQAQTQAAQLEGQRNQEANAAKAHAAQIDLEHKTKAAELDLAAKARAHELELHHAQQQHGMQMQHENQKAQHDIAHEQQKGDMAVQHETHKANIGLEAKHKESALRQTEMKAKAANDTQVETAKAKPMTDNNAKIDALGKKIDKGFEELKKAVTAKKTIKVERDAGGRVTGAAVG
jgi:hypothetical protein